MKIIFYAVSSLENDTRCTLNYYTMLKQRETRLLWIVYGLNEVDKPSRNKCNGCYQYH